MDEDVASAGNHGVLFGLNLQKQYHEWRYGGLVFALLVLAGPAPAIAQSNPVPGPGLEPIGSATRTYAGSLDSFPRYAVVPIVRLQVPTDLPPIDVKPIDGGASTRSVSPSSDVPAARQALGHAQQGPSASRLFGGNASAAALPEHHVNVRRVREELADVRAELGL